MVIQSLLTKPTHVIVIILVTIQSYSESNGQDKATSIEQNQSSVLAPFVVTRVAHRPKNGENTGELDFGTLEETAASPEVVDLEQVQEQQARFFSQASNKSLIQPPAAQAGQSIVPAQTANVDVNGNSGLFNGELYASFDFMFLERSGPDPQAFVFTNGVPTLNTTSFSYDAAFTPAATIAIGDQFGYALEFSFLSSANHRFSGTQAGTNVVPVFFGGIPAAPVNSYTITSQSQMDNFELNQWVRYSDRLRLGIGLRIIDMREVFDITESTSSDGFFSITDNEMFGGQFAAQYLFYSTDRMALYFQGKSGLYYNRVKVSATALNAQMTPDEDELSFVGDLRLVADFPLTDILSFRAGYQATFLTRVAQGVDQNDSLNLFTPTNPGLMDFSSPTYRGGFFGIVASY